MSPQFAIWLCAVLIIIAAFAAWAMHAILASLRERPHGRHAHAAFAQPDAAADRDGTVTQAWLRTLHVAEQPQLPVAGCFAVEPPA